jgi:hypothetical protein
VAPAATVDCVTHLLPTLVWRLTTMLPIVAPPVLPTLVSVQIVSLVCVSVASAHL